MSTDRDGRVGVNVILGGGGVTGKQVMNPVSAKRPMICPRNLILKRRVASRLQYATSRVHNCCIISISLN
jgi:hypothetical protein